MESENNIIDKNIYFLVTDSVQNKTVIWIVTEFKTKFYY